jgi:capsule biosynthesis phosphatase
MKIIIFDIDNTITKTKGTKYENSTPIKSKIKIINQLFDKGHIVKIFTSRYMGKHKGNISIIKKKYYKKTNQQLRSWGLKYHDLIFGKPIFDFFIDDKAFNIRDKKLNKIFYNLINLKT